MGEWESGAYLAIMAATMRQWATTIQNPPTIFRPQADHSCVGRNLTVSCMQYRQIRRRFPFPHRPFLRRQESHNHVQQQCQIRPHTPVPTQTIPAKAGISQCRACNIAKSSPDSHSPHRPFLRKQESHSAVHTISPNSPPIPIPHTDHSCEGRNLTVSCIQYRQIRPRFPFPTQTIPAKARISQSWATTMPNPPAHSRPPVDHSCVGRNLFKHGRHRRLNYAAVGGTRL